MRSLFCILLFLATGPARAHLIHVPEKFDPATASVLVVIHGCLQSAESMALGTGFNRAADARNWIVLYPQVPARTNAVDCWSWFDPENQKAGRGQLGLIMDEVARIESRWGLRQPKLFAVGISSGGATAAGLAACYPARVSAVALHSAPLYASARSLTEATKVLRDGPAAPPATPPCHPEDFRGGTLIIHGEKDTVVNPRHAELAFEQFTGGDPKRGELHRVPDLEHAWAGFKPVLKTELPFFSPKGPDATALIVKFFEK